MRPRTIALLFAAGVFLGQLAWVSAIPPYRGIDEFDHVYRAASVAEGYWGPGVGIPQDGRGDLVPVPPKIVTAGAEICRSYKYTGPDNCRAAADWEGGLVTVASAAARYNPAFYWLIGKPSQLVEGAHAVYLMRLTASLMCALLIGLAAWVTSTWAQTRWPLTALGLTLTPVVVYSSAMPAPNGIEMAGALCVWCSLLGCTRDASRRATRTLIAVASIGAVPLVLVRTLGPLWLALSVAVILLTLGRKTALDALRSVPLTAGAAGSLVVSIIALSAWWSRSAGTNALEDVGVEQISPWIPVLQEVPLWFLQSIAAFPLRNEPAPAMVYASEAIAFFALVTWAFVRAGVRIRIGLATTGFLSLAAPYAITIATVMVAGLIWQGRYTLPFSFGVVLLAGLALERARPLFRLGTALVAVLGATIAIAHAVSVVNVQHTENLGSPLAGDSRWISAPLWMVGSLGALSVSLWVVAILRAHHEEGETRGGDPERRGRARTLSRA